MNGRKLSLILVLLLTVLQLKAQEMSNMSLLGNYGKGEGQCKAVFALGTLTYFSVGEKFKVIACYIGFQRPGKIAGHIKRRRLCAKHFKPYFFLTGRFA